MNQPQITSTTKKASRQSNIELLRIVAMFLVLVVHADFWSIGVPTIEEYQSALIPSLTRTGFEFMAIICVNIFVAISGWFSIKASIRGALSFIFQCFFLTSLIYCLLLVIGRQSITLGGFRECLLLTDSLWFCKAYFALYILAPILNVYCVRANRKQFSALLIAFYIFQSTYGILGAAPFIMSGYSFFSFVGIYLSARYVRLYVACQDNRKVDNFIIGGGNCADNKLFRIRVS